MLGIEWMKRHLGGKYNVHVLSFNDKRAMHIDSTFNLIGPGLALARPTRPCNQLSMFHKAGWKVTANTKFVIPGCSLFVCCELDLLMLKIYTIDSIMIL